MIFEELLYVFRNDLEIEYLKRNVKEPNKIRLNQKQLKLIFTKVASDLQKEFKIIESSQTIATVAGEATYALTRDFMTRKEAYYDDKKLDYTTMEKINDGITAASYPTKYGIKWVNSYPYIVVNPTPSEVKNIVVKYYADIKLYSINDGIDDKAADPSDDTLYMKIPTMYDQAILLGMMKEFFDDRMPLYEKEKLRLKSMGNIELTLNEYNMTGIPDGKSYNYNSDTDATPSVLPADPT